MHTDERRTRNRENGQTDRERENERKVDKKKPHWRGSPLIVDDDFIQLWRASRVIRVLHFTAIFLFNFSAWCCESFISVHSHPFQISSYLYNSSIPNPIPQVHLPFKSHSPLWIPSSINNYYNQSVSLLVSVTACHQMGPGSIPTTGTDFFFTVNSNNYYYY